MGTFKVVTGRMSRDMTTETPAVPTTAPLSPTASPAAAETATESAEATVELRTTTRVTELLETTESLPPLTSRENKVTETERAARGLRWDNWDGEGDTRFMTD